MQEIPTSLPNSEPPSSLTSFPNEIPNEMPSSLSELTPRINLEHLPYIKKEGLELTKEQLQLLLPISNKIRVVKPLEILHDTSLMLPIKVTYLLCALVFIFPFIFISFLLFNSYSLRLFLLFPSPFSNRIPGQ